MKNPSKLMCFFCLLFALSPLLSQKSQSNAITLGQRVQLYSQVLKENREIYIYEPSSYETLENLPVIFVLDAYSQFNQTATTTDYLSAVVQGNDIIPHSIVVGITNPNRNFDLTPIKGVLADDPSTYENTGGGASFLEFITTELIPYIDSSYNTCNHRTLIGHSLGGLLVLQALLETKSYFNNYLAIDPALGFADRKFYYRVLDSLKTKDYSDEKLFVASANNRPGSMDDASLLVDKDSFLEMMDKPNFEFYKNNDTQDWNIQLVKNYYPKENHFSVPLIATQEALRFFFSYYQFKEMLNYCHSSYASKNELLPQLKEHFLTISKNLGCKRNPLESYINTWSWSMGISNRDDLAVELFEYAISLYPERSSAYNSFGYYLRNNNRPKEALVQFEKSLELENNPDIILIKDELVKEIGDKKNKK